MNILILTLVIIMIMIGIYFIIRANSLKNFYEKIKDGNISEYKKTVGIVVCDAYSIDDEKKVTKLVTPIVEYTVNGEKYETMNRVLETGAELPVGTRLYVWYKKEDPKQAILGTELESSSFEKLAGVLLIWFGIVFLLIML